MYEPGDVMDDDYIVDMLANRPGPPLPRSPRGGAGAWVTWARARAWAGGTGQVQADDKLLLRDDQQLPPGGAPPGALPDVVRDAIARVIALHEANRQVPRAPRGCPAALRPHRSDGGARGFWVWGQDPASRGAGRPPSGGAERRVSGARRQAEGGGAEGRKENKAVEAAQRLWGNVILTGGGAGIKGLLEALEVHPASRSRAAAPHAPRRGLALRLRRCVLRRAQMRLTKLKHIDADRVRISTRAPNAVEVAHPAARRPSPRTCLYLPLRARARSCDRHRSGEQRPSWARGGLAHALARRAGRPRAPGVVWRVPPTVGGVLQGALDPPRGVGAARHHGPPREGLLPVVAPPARPPPPGSGRPTERARRSEGEHRADTLRKPPLMTL